MRGDNSRKLTEEKTLYIKMRILQGVCQSALARKFGVSRQRISQLKSELPRSGEMLKAYTVCEGDNGSEYSELIFAATAKEAKKEAWKHPGFSGFEEYLQLRVKRYPKADHLAGETAGCCSDWRVLRLLEWSCEDGNACSECGLNDFDRDEFRVCWDCDKCPECGHEDDCSTK